MNEGWITGGGRYLRHYYAERGVSLCGNCSMSDVPGTPCTHFDTDQSPKIESCCKACWRKLEKRRRRKEFHDNILLGKSLKEA
jgi:hypothetical protein